MSDPPTDPSRPTADDGRIDDPRPDDVREGDDRRRHPTPMVSRYLLIGRRRAGRREGERTQIYVDRPGRAVLAAVAGVCMLSLADAFLTLRHLAHGATEANPVMRAALELGDVAFIVIKTLATMAGAAFLGLHKTWRLGRVCLAIALGGYVLLTAWHVYGLVTVRPPGA